MFAPTDAIRIRTFTWLLTWALLIYTLAWAGAGDEWLTEVGFHPRGAAMRGQQMPWGPLPAGLQWWILGPYVVAMISVILGWGGRVAVAGVLIGLISVSSLDRLSMFTFNKLAMVSYAVLLCAAVVPGEDRGQTPRLRSAWPLRILQATIVLQYFGAGVCKLHGDWLAHSDVLWMQAQGAFRTETAAWLLATLPKPAWTMMQWSALAFELLAPILLVVPRFRVLGFVWGGAMLLMIGLTMAKVGYFTFMIATYFALFVDVAWLRRQLRRLR
jgi:hypothetical protein